MNDDSCPVGATGADLKLVPENTPPSGGSWCDACEEGDTLGYKIDDALVRDFVCPAWFESFRRERLDSHNPFELMPGEISECSTWRPVRDGGRKPSRARRRPGIAEHWAGGASAASFPTSGGSTAGCSAKSWAMPGNTNSRLGSDLLIACCCYSARSAANFSTSLM